MESFNGSACTISRDLPEYRLGITYVSGPDQKNDGKLSNEATK